MASNGHHRPRNRTLILAAAIAFILSAVFLTYTCLDPLSITMSPSHDIDEDVMATGTLKHDKGGQTYPQVATLPVSHLPTNTRRLLVIGDVHGHLKSLEALLRKAEFSAARGDTVVFAGDMVNKGPDSAGVIELAMRIGAFGVRGNHEDRVLRAWEYLETKKRAKGSEVDYKPHHRDIVTAKSLKPKHRAWLSRLPLILRIGDLGPRYGEVLVVHAGLVPGVPLESQDPEAVMTMRTILLPSSYDASHLDPSFDPDPNPQTENDSQTPLTTTTQTEDQPTNTELKGSKNKHHPPKMIPSASRKGIPWAEIWTSYQQAYFSPPLPSSPSSQLLLPIRPATVVYGHDAKAGLKMRKYAFGVDSGCGNWERLTGVMFEFGEKGTHESNGMMSIEEEGEENEDGNGNGNDGKGEDGDRESSGHKARIRHHLVSVSCAEEH